MLYNAIVACVFWKVMYLCTMFEQKVQQYIEKEGLLVCRERVLVALSGGADSVALLRTMLALGYPCEAAHCNFHLREEESNRDELFVRELCQQWNVPLHVAHFDTVAYAGDHHLSIEMAARELRYGYFRELIEQIQVAHVVVAHHLNDSVETFLLNLIRGTGINGLKGIRPKNGRVVRPFLTVSRREILDYLSRIGQTYVTDSTNLQTDYTRNKIRLDLLPLMESINPSVQTGIAATAERLSEVANVYHSLMEHGKELVVEPWEDGGKEAFKISIPTLLNQPAPQSLLFELLHPLGFHSVQVSNIYKQLFGESGKWFETKDWKALKDRDYLLVAHAGCLQFADDCVCKLPVEGSLELEDGSMLTAHCIERSADFVIPKERGTACLDADKLQLPLILRRWKQGDRFVPFGMTGMKRLSDYMTDRKYSLVQKQQQWVVCSGDRICWLVGERSDNRFRVDENTRRILLLSITL